MNLFPADKHKGAKVVTGGKARDLDGAFVHSARGNNVNANVITKMSLSLTAVE